MPLSTLTTSIQYSPRNKKLDANIQAALLNDPISAAQLLAPTDPTFTLSPDGLLLLNDHIFIPDNNNLRIRVLQTKHNHPLASHFSQNKTLKLVRQEYAWPAALPQTLQAPQAASGDKAAHG
ncbi:unnamed protein product [Cyclocybe aegerita]|uniref:Integrase zinc-binding domain-containing protein n=1 Tax=Cyclocybe aegerita TaxID=1973307 RepID=A0A8S0VTM4_CYCAE|nr:unnamed protein product [Cyclocybe aegerita]